MGGAALLSRVRSIGWLGAAEVVTPERTLRLGIRTRVEPFVRASSTSWIMSEGVAKARTLMIEPDAGYVERDGKRTPLPRDQERHEREQYGLYAYMLLRAPMVEAGGKLLAASEGLPPIRFDTDIAGRLTGADYTVHAPDGGTVIQQRFTFDGIVRDKGLAWPRRIRIAQDGIPFFTLAIDSLRVELA